MKLYKLIIGLFCLIFLFQNCDGMKSIDGSLESSSHGMAFDESEYTDVGSIFGLTSITYLDSLDAPMMLSDGRLKIMGWACLKGSASNVYVRVKLGNQYYYARQYTESEVEVNEKCETVKQKHNFSVIVDKADVIKHPGQPIFVTAFDDESKTKSTFKDSGNYKISGKLKVASPSKITVANIEGPADPLVTVHGVKGGDRVNLYSDFDCETSAAGWGPRVPQGQSSVNLRANLIFGKKYKIYAKISRNGEASCSKVFANYAVTDDFISPPGVRTYLGQDKGNTTVTIELNGTQKGDLIGVYSDALCRNQIASGTTQYMTNRGFVTAHLEQGKVYQIYGKIENRKGKSSACSYYFAQYETVTDIPRTPHQPQLITSRASGEPDPVVSIKSIYVSGDKVDLYKDNDCKGVIIGSNTVADSEAKEGKVIIKANLKKPGTYRLRAKTTRNGVSSGCSYFNRYGVKNNSIPSTIEFKGELQKPSLVSGSTLQFSGWACIVGYEEKLGIRIKYKEGNQFIVLDESDTYSTWGVNQEEVVRLCKTGGTPHYFYRNLGSSWPKNLIGKAVYAEAYSSITSKTYELKNSGKYRIPDPAILKAPVINPSNYNVGGNGYVISISNVASGDKVRIYKDSQCKIPASEFQTVKAGYSGISVTLTKLIAGAGKIYKLRAQFERGGEKSPCTTNYHSYGTIVNSGLTWSDPGTTELLTGGAENQYTQVRDKTIQLRIENSSKVILSTSTPVLWPHGVLYEKFLAVSRITIDGVKCGRQRIEIPTTASVKHRRILTTTRCSLELEPGTYEISYRGRGWTESLTLAPELEQGYVSYYITPIVEK